MKKNKLIKKLLSDNYELTKELKRLERQFDATLLLHKEELEKATWVSTYPANNSCPPDNWITYYGVFATPKHIANFDIWLSKMLEYRNVSHSEIFQKFNIPPRPGDEHRFISSVEQVNKKIHPGDHIDLALFKAGKDIKE